MHSGWGPFENSGSIVWSGEVQDSLHPWGFDFFGGSEYCFARESGNSIRAFAVSSGSGTSTSTSSSTTSGIIEYNGLEWRLGSDEDTARDEAREWVDGLDGDWRMPTGSELEELYAAGIRYSDWGPFENSGAIVWSSEVRDSMAAWGFSFYRGWGGWLDRDGASGRRAFAVRSR